MAEHNELGKWGEDEAVRFLENKGYEILERDWKLGKRDLDVVALTEDRETIVFVEVKTRQNDDYQEPEEAVDVCKMRNLAIAANAYIKMYEVRQQVRFDIISVIGKRNDVLAIKSFEDAFNPLLVL